MSKELLTNIFLFKLLYADFVTKKFGIHVRKNYCVSVQYTMCVRVKRYRNF